MEVIARPMGQEPRLEALRIQGPDLPPAEGRHAEAGAPDEDRLSVGRPRRMEAVGRKADTPGCLAERDTSPAGLAVGLGHVRFAPNGAFGGRDRHVGRKRSSRKREPDGP